MTEAQQFIMLEQDEEGKEEINSISFQDHREYQDWLSKNNLKPYKYN